MNRREAVLAPLAAGAWPSVARAQQPGRVYRIGYLSAPTRASVESALQSFLRALRDLGWIEGQNLQIEYRWAEGKVERLPDLAAELVRSNVDVIVAPAASAALAAKAATSTIPIVMIFPSNPVSTGLVTSLRMPGGNITGTTSSPGPGIFAKQLQLLKESAPHASRVAVLLNPADPASGEQVRELDAVAAALGIRLQHVPARAPQDFDRAFDAMARERAQALLVSRDALFLANRGRIAELAMKASLPAMFAFRESVEVGGMMAYAVNMSDFIARAAGYVDKILRGAKPADLPVEQPMKFEFVVNIKTAKALGIAIPPSLLLRADEVLQ